MTYLQLTAHLFLLLFWARLWVKPDQAFTFNPFLSGTTRLVAVTLDFLRPALRLPDRLTALLALLFFWAFQVMFFAQFGTAWCMTFGLVQFAPTTETLAWRAQFFYSALYSAQFLIEVWTLYFFTRLIAPPNRMTRAQEALTFFMSPFSRLPTFLQPIVLLALHAALVFAVTRTGAVPFFDLEQEGKNIPSNLFVDGSLMAQVRILLLALMSFASGLQTLMYTLVFFLFGGLAAMLFGLQLPALICRESVDVLLGRFSRGSAAAGGMDFTPVLFMIVVNIISSQLLTLLQNLMLAS
ncbi:MAG: hypothetical protein FWG50_03800 [Kiritimatiellaeota bacterium]|nr:hypothetical protein [Kiritimatiellota bacterium]